VDLPCPASSIGGFLHENLPRRDTPLRGFPLPDARRPRSASLILGAIRCRRTQKGLMTKRSSNILWFRCLGQQLHASFSFPFKKKPRSEKTGLWWHSPRPKKSARCCGHRAFPRSPCRRQRFAKASKDDRVASAFHSRKSPATGRGQVQGGMPQRGAGLE
jgi:hypothetical protein